MNESGAGVARIDGCVVFVDGAVEGDVCEIRITERKKNYALAEIAALQKPSPFRREPDCPVYGVCGGCSLRHISFEAENRCKRQTLLNAFRRCGLEGIPVSDTLYGRPTQYRNKAVFHYADGKFGYYSEKTNRLTDVLPCALLPERLNAVAQWINEATRSLSGIRFRSLYLRTAEDGAISVIFSLKDERSVEKIRESGFATALLRRFPSATGVLAETDGSYTVLCGERALTDVLLGLRFLASPEGFWQVNHEATELLANRVTEYARKIDFDALIDLYCGSGVFGLLLASALREKGARYYGVERNPRSIEDARRNAATNGVDNITFFCGDAADFQKKIPASSLRNSLVLIDPPRAGCSPQMLRSLTELAPADILYISCNPNTLSRDCARLTEAGYFPLEAVPVNLFPRTKHIESLVRLRRRDAAEDGDV